MKTSELSGAALDWAVAKCEGRKMQRNPMGPQGGHGWWIWEETPSGQGGILLDKSVYMALGPYIRPKTRRDGEKFSPSTNWAQGGPIIDREGFAFEFDSESESFIAFYPTKQSSPEGVGDTHLLAALRCYVASKVGDELSVPSELLE
ncbi:Bacteriophage P22, NinX [uncultured Caudovirales phage]|uniref:Bacteriophage P22, NinX n=1 Tax=uncultured Caudovirales phage TaxID=2100421 RepID=A0A6J5KGL9_9CAUD|nr:Bacteriophage P22, NinX [uncultured Caudovirales phage]